MAELRELKARLGLDSETSNQPPSQDQPWKSKVKSERQKTGRSSGGQPGHPGKTLKMVDDPDNVVTLHLTGRCACGRTWEGVEVADLIARQVHDLPEFRLQVTEYQAEVKVCPCCHQCGQATFPAHVPGQVCYGPRLLATAIFLNVGHFIPLERVTQILAALFGACLSDGTVALNLTLAAQRLVVFDKSLKTALLKQPVLHADETGSKVNGKLHWLHVVSCAQLTLYGHHPQRGFAALQAMEVLPQFQGVVVHDAWSTYFRLPGSHALCNAHLLRELRGLSELCGQDWAGELRTALQEVYHRHKSGTLTPEEKAAFLTRWEVLVAAGLEANPPAKPIPRKRGRVKQSHGRNVALRCQQHRCAMLRFLDDPLVPFDNNLAERDIRMTCVKRKVSGGFRSAEGGETFCRIRSYLSTLHKQGMNAWQGLISVFRGDVLMPAFSC